MPDSYTHLWLQKSDAVCGLSGYLASSWAYDAFVAFLCPDRTEVMIPVVIAPRPLRKNCWHHTDWSKSDFLWWLLQDTCLQVCFLDDRVDIVHAGVLSPGWLKKSSSHFVHSTPDSTMPKVRPGIFGACGSAGQGWPSQWASEVRHNACVILCIYGSGSLDATLEDMFDGLVPCSFVGSDTGMYSFNADFRLLLAQHAPAATVSAVSFLPVPLLCVIVKANDLASCNARNASSRWAARCTPKAWHRKRSQRRVFAGRRAWRIRIWNAQRRVSLRIKKPLIKV